MGNRNRRARRAAEAVAILPKYLPALSASGNDVETMILEADLNLFNIVEFAFDDLIGKLVQDGLLDQSFDRTRAIIGIKPVLGDVLFHRRVDGDIQIALGKPA